VDTADVREFAEQIDRVLADTAAEPARLDSLLDDAETVANALEGETTRLHREIDRVLDRSGPIMALTSELRECYRDLELLRPRVRELRVRVEVRRSV
jgi:hypothetical protein